MADTDQHTPAQQQADRAQQKQRDRDFQTVKEKTEVLDGSRSAKVLGKAAVRLEDLTELQGFSSNPVSKPVTAAPTKDDFNALVEDNKRLYALLGTLAVALGRRLS